MNKSIISFGTSLSTATSTEDNDNITIMIMMMMMMMMIMYILYVFKSHPATFVLENPSGDSCCSKEESLLNPSHIKIHPYAFKMAK